MLAALRRSGANVTTLSTRPKPSATLLRNLRDDVVIVDTIAAPTAGALIRAARANGARIVTLALMSRGAVRLARGSARVIAVSRALADELRDAGIPRSRIAVIAPGTTRVARAGGRPVASPRAGHREVRVLCVANWARAKGIHTLLAAARNVPEISLDLVGAQPDSAYARRVREHIAHPKLAGRVRIYGVVTGERLERLYRAAAFFALPSTLESYGMAVGDALAHGLPVIACDIPATREVTERAALLVPPRRVRPLEEALRYLAGDQRRRDSLARRARDRASRLPTWHQSEGQLVREVLRGTSPQ
jgi:glycosyltransferase involved in cell wall biosynthesis